MFDTLSNRLQGVFKKLSGQGVISEAHLDEAMREVRVALLEADVNLQVAKTFIKAVKEKALGQEVLKSITPTQQIIKIVHDELVRVLGTTQADIAYAKQGSTVVMLVGLQGSGKTTTAGKLANLLRKKGKQPLLVAADIYRPAAIDQLKTLGKQLGLPVFERGTKESPLRIAELALKEAAAIKANVVLIDTAGRLHLDETMMSEVTELKTKLHPHEILLVVDAMTGQDAVNLASAFHEKVGIDGIILTKLDGDARGGAALSVVQVTGKPIKFVGIGEKLDALEPFHPDRLASRILGMGDVLTLVEKAQEVVSEAEAKKMYEKVKKAELTLSDFADQMRRIRKMGPMEKILGMIPGFDPLKSQGMPQMDEKKLTHIEAIIHSMTQEEREEIEILTPSRRERVARGSGTTVQEVNTLIHQFKQTRKMLKALTSGHLAKGMKGFPKLPKGFPPSFPGF